MTLTFSLNIIQIYITVFEQLLKISSQD